MVCIVLLLSAHACFGSEFEQAVELELFKFLYRFDFDYLVNIGLGEVEQHTRSARMDFGKATLN